MLALAVPMLVAAALATAPSASSVCPASDRTPTVSQAPAADATLVPPGADSLTVCRYNGLANPPPLSVAGFPAFGLVGVGVVGDQATIARLASELNALPLASGVRSCPADFGNAVVAYFGYPSGPGDVVRVGLSGCNDVSNGHIKRLGLGAPVVGQLAVLAKLLQRPATFTGYERLCGGPAPGRCWITQRYGVCDGQAPCVMTDRVQVLNAAGAVVATARLHRGRFAVTVPKPGRYTLELLGDGRRRHGVVMSKINAIARAGRASHVVFTIAVP
jgi:hypothetical protein